MHASHRNTDGTPKYTNYLASETSPYLRQHAHNPVDWYPWGSEALERARREAKPIHLSVGYLACHWCHRLAEESFEDEATAKILNDNFVNIKVDREERPDIDRIYQIAQQMLTQRGGGWPLTMFLTHDEQRPFFGGTYFPKEARHGLPAFKDILLRVAAYYREHAAELRRQNEALMAAFSELNPPAAGSGVELTAAPLASCRAELARVFDHDNGGLRGAPKFPHPQTIEWLLRRWHATARSSEPDAAALQMATLTLRRMADGGINDQLGGGFCRYSVDERWMIPHFEKMLYDNAALLAAYAQAALAASDRFLAQVANRTADWVLREMESADGSGYYSSLDADSEGHEGTFYVWDREEIRAALNSAEFAVFAPRFGFDQPANFEGRWHLHVTAPLEDVARLAGRTPPEAEALIDAARAKLLALRARRVRPARDEKVLTSWNALMIRGMAVAARALQRGDLAASATRALDFVRARLWRDGRLLATYMDGRAHLNAYLDDYVYLADAILELQQLRFRAEELAFARTLAEVVLEHFADPGGGFYFTSDDHETLIHRTKAFADDATPAGNGVGAHVLLRLGYLLGESRYLAAAEQTLRAAWPALERYPHGHVSLLGALEELLTPPEIVILRGEARTIGGWRDALAPVYAPHRLLLAIPSEATGLPPAIADKAPRGAPAAYLCRGSTCSAPIDSLDELIEQLGEATID